MIKLNNKGQSLVMFILIIPMLLGMIVLVVDVGNAIYSKNKIRNLLLVGTCIICILSRFTIGDHHE